MDSHVKNVSLLKNDLHVKRVAFTCKNVSRVMLHIHFYMEFLLRKLSMEAVTRDVPSANFLWSFDCRVLRLCCAEYIYTFRTVKSFKQSSVVD